MPKGLKDLGELHIVAVESGQPEMFHKVSRAMCGVRTRS